MKFIYKALLITFCNFLFTLNDPINSASIPPKTDSKQILSKKPFDLALAFDDLKEIIAGGTLRVAIVNEDRFPFFFKNKQGKLVGVDIELSEKIAERLGVKVEFIRTKKEFNDVVKQVAKGEAHVAISKLSYTPDRAKQVLYSSEPYVSLHKALLINRAQLDKLSPDILLKDLDKKNRVRIAVLKGSSQVQMLPLLFPNAEVVQFDKFDQGNFAVLHGECFARYSDDSELTKLLLLTPEYNFKCIIVALKGELDHIYIAIGKKYPNLQKFINLLLKNEQLKPNDIQSIFKKYENDLK